jgi:hypothetical protein
MTVAYLSQIAVKLREALYLILDAEEIAKQAPDEEDRQSMRELSKTMAAQLELIETKRGGRPGPRR